MLCFVFSHMAIATNIVLWSRVTYVFDMFTFRRVLVLQKVTMKVLSVLRKCAQCYTIHHILGSNN